VTALEAAPLLTAEAMRAFVRDHRVCWETAVHRDRGPDGVAAVGYDVTLMAQCREQACDPGGTCVMEVYEHLAQLVDAVRPSDGPDDVRLAPFEPALHLRAGAAWQPEVQLVIEVRHDHDYFAAIDDDERSAVGRIERALGAWGVQHEVWQAPQDSRSTLPASQALRAS
jgi:hypothetical protein